METETVENKARPAPAPPIVVRVVDFDIPFWSLVGFLLKLCFATIPAAIVITFLGIFLYGAIPAIFMHHR